jgi:hypothetical protein
MKHHDWLFAVLALAIIITGCAYNGDESGSGEPYRQPSHAGHQH